MERGGRDDETWRSIVDNYGERAQLDPVDHPDLPATAPGPSDRTAAEPAPEPSDPPPDPGDRFVPPDPPPVPRPSRDRLLAWCGVLGTPVLVLLLLLLGIRVGGLLLGAFVVAFIGGFGYLVMGLPRSPEDPWDDGARL